MKLQGLVILVLLASVSSASADIGEFFEKLFSVFKPSNGQGNSTDAHVNATGFQNVTELPVSATVVNTTDLVSTAFPNSTESGSAKLDVDVTLVNFIALATVANEEDSEFTTAATTVDDTTIESTTLTTVDVNTTTVVYKLFHPNTTSTTESTTVAAGNSTDNLKSSNSFESTSVASNSNSTTGEASTTTSSSYSATSPTTSTSPSNAVDSTTSLTTSTASSSSNNTSTTLTSPLASSTVVSGVLCTMTYDPDTNVRVTSCADSSSTNSTESSVNRISKRSADEYLRVLPVSSTYQDESELDIYPTTTDSDGSGEYVDDYDVSSTTINTNRQ